MTSEGQLMTEKDRSFQGENIKTVSPSAIRLRGDGRVLGSNLTQRSHPAANELLIRVSEALFTAAEAV